jgi:CHASE3 domain sensor protein
MPLAWPMRRARTPAKRWRHQARILCDLKDIETGERGFLVTGVEHYFEPYDAGKELLLQAQAELHARTSGADPELRQEIALLDRVVAQKAADASRTIAQRRAAKAYVFNLTAMDLGKRDMNRARELQPPIPRRVARARARALRAVGKAGLGHHARHRPLRNVQRYLRSRSR